MNLAFDMFKWLAALFGGRERIKIVEFGTVKDERGRRFRVIVANAGSNDLYLRQPLLRQGTYQESKFVALGERAPLRPGAACEFEPDHWGPDDFTTVHDPNPLELVFRSNTRVLKKLRDRKVRDAFRQHVYLCRLEAGETFVEY